MADTYTVDGAQAELARLRPVIDQVVEVRADLAELGAAVRDGVASRLGRLPELKAAQARLDELVSEIVSAGVEIKGIAPLLLDFPSVLDGEPVLLCWVEGEPELAWYHRADLGFAGRRPLPAA
ncbi:DUF2203 domain-containing protein [Jiangella asiatica]|uniref:DUF2203 family protein n=1 Tax=Jiangella asiatica TaxID=2530372 RepID=A0A4R5CKD9_9ACTN|nr:DUF2203 domain-containing protein [Jiangella asiatica]TDE00779.1 DUF2203 family protein [Jiangella asiatica]